MAKTLNKETVKDEVIGNLTKPAFREQIRQLIALEKDAKDARDAISAHRKNMKTTFGMNMKMLDVARYLAENEDAALASMEFNELAKYLEWLNVDVARGEQMKLLDTGAPAMSTEDGDIAHHKGSIAARAGANKDTNPYPLDSASYKAWDKGYDDEQYDMAKELAPGANKNGAGGKAAKGGKGKKVGTEAPATAH